MVIYFLSKTKGKEEYLGTIQCFFLINVIYSTAFRVINGILTVDLFGGIGLGMVGILLGLWIANKIVDKLDANNIGQLIYFFELACGMSGSILGVNPFNQPGVEKYKNNMFKLLGKPGYTK